MAQSQEEIQKAFMAYLI
jgi:hypothetical protein